MKLSDATLSALARQIAENRAADDFKFWILFGALLIVVISIGAIFRAYFTERGRLKALAATLTERLEEIRKYTDLTERLKVKIAHEDWTLKELKTLRRNKLELLVTASYELITTMNTDSLYPEPGDKYVMTSNIPLLAIKQLSILYFPELNTEINAIMRAHAEVVMSIARGRARIYQQFGLIESAAAAVKSASEKVPLNMLDHTLKSKALAKATDEMDIIRNDYADTCGPATTAVTDTVLSLHSRASKLMAELIAPTA